MAKPIVSFYSLSTLPIIYCDVGTEPKPSDQSLNINRNNISNFKISFVCSNQWYTSSTIPETTRENRVCERNSYSTYYTEKESSFTCTGEPDSD